MRSGRGAWMRFPDVSAEPVSFKELIAGSEKESESVRDADSHPCDAQIIPPVAGGSSHPRKIHVSPPPHFHCIRVCVCACVGSAPHR